MYRKYCKRLLDIVVSLASLIILSPLILAISVILWIQNRGNVFFYQMRPGKDEKPFKIIKFKTMTDDRDAEGHLLPDIHRMTNVGKVIRKLSIDEIPQLINVLRGEMSIVGPRPLLFKYIPLYAPEQRRRHIVRPGITGWAQVNGRNAISWTRKFELDLYYVEHMSFALDIKILWLTVLKVVRSEGVNQSSARPMRPFDGSN